jgi:sulfate adenylyltransferase subunit 2
MVESMVVEAPPPVRELRRDDGADLQQLEDAAVEILREGAACSRKPVLLYSIGKDSSVLLHLAQRAFSPGPVPFPLLHIDTTWKFRDMIAFRDQTARELGLNLIVHTNSAGVAAGVTPFSDGSERYTDIMKTAALRQALDLYRFDLAFGGARRDEERSRAKERVFSVRTSGHQWDPRAQRPELWNLYNARLSPGQSMRVFPLSDWTEIDVWRYIRLKQIPVVPLYFACSRRVVCREGQWIMVDDDRMPLEEGETPSLRRVRFRTLGCYPLSAAMESDADDLDKIIDELRLTRHSEREGRVIDHDGEGSMERKKREGYF